MMQRTCDFIDPWRKFTMILRFNAVIWVVGAMVLAMLAGLSSVAHAGTDYLIIDGRLGMAPHLFSTLPACAAGTEGQIAAVTDSTTATWGATITGGSTHHVAAYCDGTNWTVFAG